MSIYSGPPPSRTFIDDKPTLLVCWWCTSFAATIIVFRVIGRYVRTEHLFKEDWLAFACLIPMLLRMGMVHMVLVNGTNNMLTDGVASNVLATRVTGSKEVLAARVFYAATLWMLKLAVSQFFKRLTPIHLWKASYEFTFQITRWFLLATFLTTVIADVAECRPIFNYWQVVPDPGPHCRQAYAHLITLGVCNVLTDLLLILFPIPIIIDSQMNPKRKLQLALLFALSAIPIATTCLRIPNIIDRQGNQAYRSLWASIEILGASTAANALVLGSFVRDRGVKKLKYRMESTSDTMERSTSRRETLKLHWGSDEDLVGSLGLGVKPGLRHGSEEATSTPRVASKANVGGPPVRLNNWRFPDTESEENDLVKVTNDQTPDLHDISSINPPRKVSFFDVGGLLDVGPDVSQRGISMASEEAPNNRHTMSQDSGSTLSSGQGSRALLQDLGGIVSSLSNPRTPRPSQQDFSTQGNALPWPRESSSHVLHDVGGLLK